MYMKQHNGQSLRTITGATNGQQPPTKKVRIAVWGTTFGNNRFNTILLNPCRSTTPTEWGCGRFMEYQGISVVQINKYASRAVARWSDPPINEIEPIEVRAKGVPISDLYDGGDLNDKLDSDYVCFHDFVTAFYGLPEQQNTRSVGGRMRTIILIIANTLAALGGESHDVEIQRHVTEFLDDRRPESSS